MMKKRILFLADIDSSHTRKWAISLAGRGYEIGIFSLRRSATNWFAQYPAIRTFEKEGFGSGIFHGSSLAKLSYLRLLPRLKKVIREFDPQIVHAHYATSYGLLGVRSGFHPLVISVWGSDIFEFARKSPLHRRLVTNNLRKADAVFSTSQVMKDEVLRYVKREVSVTPFGVDVQLYRKKEIQRMFGDAKVVGTIKSMESHYGIDVLIRAFGIVKRSYAQPLKLLICGGGTKEAEYKVLAAQSEFSADIIFTGRIPQEEVPDHHNQLDIFLNLSSMESFGVAVVEAMACERPVIATAVGGLPEVVENEKTGFLIPPNDPEAAAAKMLLLLNNPQKMETMGNAGRARVLEHFDWEKNLDHIESLYRTIA